MKDYTEIQCPNCAGKILIDSKLLLQGGSFSCSNESCDTSISLSDSSHQLVDNAMDEFEKLKKTQDD